jgi:hypothetical protein
MLASLEMVPTWAISSLQNLRPFLEVGDTASTAKSSRARSIGFAGGDRPDTSRNGMSKDRRGCRAVAGLACWSGDVLDHLRAHVLELVRKLDLLGHGDTVLGDPRRAIALVEDDVTALGP